MTKTNPLVHVAVGVILNSEKQALIAKRAEHLHQGGLWEFPGGKLDQGETVSEALYRELKEELDISVVASHPFMKIHHDYPDKSVLLDVWLVTTYSGTVVGKEGQPIIWVDLNKLIEYEFPQANQPIVERLARI